ncbi:thymidine kinase [Candidatus Uhrbacteria bacterium]|nr:MAG: thymidine kinase [Candidatus Uhrbacteria bacterium]
MAGSLTMFAGCMASGKSALLLNRVAFLRTMNLSAVVSLPVGRYGNEMRAFSRAGPSEYALRFKEANDLRRWTHSDKVLAIDEIQDQELWVSDVLEELKRSGCKIIVAGRDTNFRGEPYPIMEALRTIADEYTQLTAVCTVCQLQAERSQRLVLGEPAHWDSPILEQGPPRETYEPRCLAHHVVPR